MFIVRAASCPFNALAVFSVFRAATKKIVSRERPKQNLYNRLVKKLHYGKERSVLDVTKII